MKYIKAILFLFAITFSITVSSQVKVFITKNRWQANATVYITQNRNQADHSIYLTTNCSECKQYAHWCQVDKLYKADLVIFITDKHWQADLIIYITAQKYNAK